MEPGKSLTRKQFEDVMRRATELAAEGTESDDVLLDEEELLRIAGEVGLPEHHVRRALAEVRGTPPVARGPVGRVFGPAVVGTGRVVPGTAQDLSRAIDEFMVAGQLLQPVRRGSEVLSYRPAVDWASQLARAASATSKRHYVASAKSVEVGLEAVDEDRVFVRLEVDPGTRNEHVAGALTGGAAAAVAAGLGIGFLTVGAVPVALAVAAGVVVGGAVGTGVVWAAGVAHRRRLQDVQQEVEGILDRLESGESLEPPPPSWRRWVRRHFHGVARDLRGDQD